MARDYLSLASLEIVPWWNVRHVGAESCVIPYWFCIISHWFTCAPPWLFGRPRFLPSNDPAEAFAHLGPPLVASPTQPWLLLRSALGFAFALVCAPRSPLGGP